MAYADHTRRDPNPVKRWLQDRRYADALAMYRAQVARDARRVLDFGAGDGELVRRLAAERDVEVCVYEPNPELLAEARTNLAGVGSIAFVDRLDAVAARSFDCVLCLEVFEHLPEQETARAIDDIHRLLTEDGTALVGVPNELFLPALLKGLFRMSRRFGDFDARPRHVAAAVLGRRLPARPMGELAPGLRYHFHHLGFDHREFEDALRRRFTIVSKCFSPLPILGAALSSEIYYVLRRRMSAG